MKLRRMKRLVISRIHYAGPQQARNTLLGPRDDRSTGLKTISSLLHPNQRSRGSTGLTGSEERFFRLVAAEESHRIFISAIGIVADGVRNDTAVYQPRRNHFTLFPRVCSQSSPEAACTPSFGGALDVTKLIRKLVRSELLLLGFSAVLPLV